MVAASAWSRRARDKDTEPDEAVVASSARWSLGAWEAWLALEYFDAETEVAVTFIARRAGGGAGDARLA